MKENVITIVSGLPRSGTSLMMRMLEAGGMKVLTDKIRKADDDNPKGYYEFERVKQIENDSGWLKDAEGKVVKMISALLKHLPDGYNYKIIFMRRKIEEILASQKQMLKRRGKPTDEVSDKKMAKLYQEHLKQVEKWLTNRTNFSILNISYNNILENPVLNVRKINFFLNNSLDTDKMVSVVDKKLYRQRY